MLQLACANVLVFGMLLIVSVTDALVTGIVRAPPVTAVTIAIYFAMMVAVRQLLWGRR